jgi:glycosyltransferase involved in cell wall biosynthesis
MSPRQKQVHQAELEATVLMPVHNGQPYLSAAIDSVLAQSLRDFEFLIIDDGSTDGSDEMIRAYAARDRRIVAIFKENTGIADTLNLGLERARAPLIVRMDADDLMKPNRVLRQAAFMRSHGELAFAGCHFEMIDRRGRPFLASRPEPVTHEALAALLEREAAITFTHPTVIYRRDLVQAAGGYRPETEPSEDTDLFSRLICAGQPGLVQPEILMQYRIHGGSVSGRQVATQFERHRWVTRNFYRRRRGEQELDLAGLRAELAAAGLLGRLHEGRRQWSAILMRQALYDLADRRLIAAAARVAVAALMRPAAAARRLTGRRPARAIGRAR